MSIIHKDNIKKDVLSGLTGLYKKSQKRSLIPHKSCLYIYFQKKYLIYTTFFILLI